MSSSDVINITGPQRELIFSEYESPAIFGGMGSGKSEALIIRLVTLMEQDPGISVGHYFPSRRLAKRRGLSGVQAYLRRLGYEYAVNRTDLTITVPALNNGIYYLDTYHEPDAIVSYEIAHAGVDELDTLKKEDAEYVWQKINERIREETNHPFGNTCAVASTPDHGTSGFCYEKWGSGEKIADGYHYIRAGTDSNPFLPKGYVEKITKNYDPLMVEAFVGGGWVSFTRNKVYHFFDRIKHHSDREIQSEDKLLIGIDFNIGGCCATTVVVDSGDAIAVDEFVSHDTHDFVLNLKSRYKDSNIIIYPDASGGNNSTNASATDIEIIENAGFAVDAPDKNPFVRDRINSVNGLLSHGRLLVNTNNCPELTVALEGQGYDKKGQPEKFNDHPSIDDRLDGLGYLIHQRFPLQRPSAAPRTG